MKRKLTAEQREKHNAYQRKRYREWTPERKARHSAYQRKWRMANPKKIRAYHRAYYAAHPEKVRAHRRAYYAKHRDEINARSRKWHQEHLEQYRACDLRRWHHRRMRTRAQRAAYNAGRRAKYAALGIRIRRQRGGANEVRFGVDHYLWQQLETAAERYCHDSVAHLMRHMAQIVVLDDLFSAVLDAPGRPLPSEAVKPNITTLQEWHTCLGTSNTVTRKGKHFATSRATSSINNTHRGNAEGKQPCPHFSESRSRH